MGSFKVEQRTKDAMFNATSLLKQWNLSEGLLRGKEVNGFLKTKPTQEFIETLAESEGLNTNRIVLTTKGKNGGTWMHPYLFIDFAMWINPKFKLQVIKFVYDELIKYRHDAGDYYRTLSSSGTKLKGYNYSEIAKALQWIVFNRTEKNIRQNATESELKELADIQQKLAWSIDMGFINSYNKLITDMQKIWRKKYKQINLNA